MIRKIDIASFGQFRDFKWDRNLSAFAFQKMNIFYGRNYSGKTTLSRIFRCVEKKELHPNYLASAWFQMHLSDNTSISQSDVDKKTSDLNIKVYNTDFVRENLAWFYNSDGTIKPFTILGDTNVDIEEKIEEIEKQLGSLETESGLHYELHRKNLELDAKTNDHDSRNIALLAKLRDKAREIKNDALTFNFPTYQINSIIADADNIDESYILSNELTQEKKNLLSELVIKPLQRFPEKTPNFAEYFSQTKTILEKEIKPSKAIQYLLDDYLLQEWVRRGIDNHRGKRKDCAFCGSPLPENIWDNLDAHFSQESESLRESISQLIDKLKKSSEELDRYVVLTKNQFYSKFHSKIDNILEQWEEAKKIYSGNIASLIAALETRNNDIFSKVEISPLQDNSFEIAELLKQINYLIDENNLQATTLISDQAEAREQLRLSEVARFLKTIDYQNESALVEQLKEEQERIAKEFFVVKNQIPILWETKRRLQAQMRDEGKGAELVNKYLTRFFGHDELKLVSKGEKPEIIFDIVREGEDAKNLSEGECSLISFCYFLAKLEEEVRDSQSLKKLIIYIDDPISSLDNNHIFHIFSVIDTLIAKPESYGQLFISTHNLDFLKYLKKITRPKGDETIGYFLIEKEQRQNDKRSKISLMPDHLREYVTEFNYLFREIHRVYGSVSGEKKQYFANTYNQIYNLPNNIRKFLECYLFYKYPNNKNPLDNLQLLFDDNVPSLINRVVNEYSHLTYLDRGWKPIDIDEAEKCAAMILTKIKEKDPDQYSALCQSVGVNDNE